MAVDFLSVLRAGQSLVPDLRAQLMQDEQRKLINEQRQMQIADRQQKQQRLAQFQAALAEAGNSSDPGVLSRLMAQFPEFAEQIKPGWEALREEEKRRNLTQTGSAYSRANAGDFKGAASILQRRYDADVAAGVADEETKQLIDALNSDDPSQQRQAASLIGMRLAAYDPDKFSETYKALNPTDKTSPVMREYNDRVAQFGKKAADNWLQTQDTKLVPVQPGGTVYAYGGATTGAPQGATAPQPQGGGDQSTGGRVQPTGSAIERAALAAVPGINVTSRRRSPAKNSSVGGVSNSYHLTDQARDFTPPRGMSMGQLHARLKAALPGFDVINEGDHVHVEPGPGMARNSAPQGPVRVRSVQEARKLPSGTVFITPDGRTMRKP